MKNRYEIKDTHAEILVTSNRFPKARILVDFQDLDLLLTTPITWTAIGTLSRPYAAYKVRRHPLKPLQVYMHRFLMGAPSGLVVDHINHNTLDNRRENLRVVTPAANSLNNRALGVTFDTQCARWKARIHFQGRQRHAGFFSNKEDAIAAASALRTQLLNEAIG